MTSRLPITERLGKAMRQPKELLAGSVVEGKFVHNDSALRYYYFPEVELNKRLNVGAGYGGYMAKPEIDGHLDVVLEAIQKYEQENGRISAHIVCWRGILTQVMAVCWDAQSEVTLHAQNFDGQIFLEIDHKSQMEARLKQSSGPNNEKFMYGGYNFEKFATLPRPWGECTRENIDSRYKGSYQHGSEYCTIVSSGVGSVKMVYGAEVDCVEGEKDPKDPLSRYVELKTTGTIGNQRNAGNFERKIARSWAQSFLVGTKKIVYGFRDPNLNLKAVEEFEVEKMPGIVKNSQNLAPEQKWNGKDAIQFLAIFVSWLKDTVKPNETYTLRHAPGSGFFELKPVQLEFEKRLGFLPAGFIQWRVQQMQAAQAAQAVDKEKTL